MKYFPLLYLLFPLLCISSSNANKVSEDWFFPGPSVVSREELKKLPRLGMTLNQLIILWGNPLGGSNGVFEWEDVGGLQLKVDFSPLYLIGDDSSFSVKPDRSRCLSIRFSYVEDSVSLNNEEALKISEALIPGFIWVKKGDSQVSEKPFVNSSSLSLPEVIYSATKAGRSYELCRDKGNFYLIRFMVNPKLVKIETDKL